MNVSGKSFDAQEIDLDRPSVARVYDWYLGGTTNWAVDREFGERVLSVFPQAKTLAISNRQFLHRVVRHLTKKGIRQFIDIGAGVPTMGHTHAIADEISRDTKVVYIDNEPVAVAHSQVVLESHGDPRRHAAVNADLRDADGLWKKVEETGVINFKEPIALLMIAVLHVFQPDNAGNDMSKSAVELYRDLLPPNSYLAISHGTDEGVPEEVGKQLTQVQQMYGKNSSSRTIWRTHQEVLEFFGDFELIEPGLTWVPLWHPEESSPNSPAFPLATPNESAVYGGVGFKA